VHLTLPISVSKRSYFSAVAILWFIFPLRRALITCSAFPYSFINFAAVRASRSFLITSCPHGFGRGAETPLQLFAVTCMHRWTFPSRGFSRLKIFLTRPLESRNLACTVHIHALIIKTRNRLLHYFFSNWSRQNINIIKSCHKSSLFAIKNMTLICNWKILYLSGIVTASWVI
jgi:hypothetical protein